MRFLTALGLLFLGLKLGNVIDWNWILVVLPLALDLVAQTSKQAPVKEVQK